MSFEINLIFLIKPLFLHDQKVKTKIYVSWERRKLLRWNKKYFSLFLKGFNLSKKNNFFFGNWEFVFKDFLAKVSLLAGFLKRTLEQSNDLLLKMLKLTHKVKIYFEIKSSKFQEVMNKICSFKAFFEKRSLNTQRGGEVHAHPKHPPPTSKPIPPIPIPRYATDSSNLYGKL